MKIKPIYEDISCAALGYEDVTVRVRINPTEKMVHDYWDAHRALIEAIPSGKYEAEEAAFEDAMVALVDSVRQGDEVIQIDSREALNAFGEAYDIHIIRFGLQMLWDVRNDRVGNAGDRFRGTASKLPVSEDKPAAA